MELMIAVAIVGILAAIAYPSYQQYQLRTVRGEGQECLVSLKRRQESFYVRNNRYADDLATLQPAADGSCGESDLYEISVLPATAACPAASCYELRAEAQGRQARDGDLSLRFDYRLSESAGREQRRRTAGGVVHSW